MLTKSPRVQKCVHYIWSLRLIKNCPHICNLSIFCPLGKAAWAARSVDSGHNFYYPFTYTFAIIILFNVPHPKKVKSWRQKRWIWFVKKISFGLNLILQSIIIDAVQFTILKLNNYSKVKNSNNRPKGGQSSQNSLPVNDDSFYPGQRPTGATPGLQPTCPKNICHLVIFASQPTLYKMCHWMKMWPNACSINKTFYKKLSKNV